MKIQPGAQSLAGPNNSDTRLVRSVNSKGWAGLGRWLTGARLWLWVLVYAQTPAPIQAEPNSQLVFESVFHQSLHFDRPVGCFELEMASTDGPPLWCILEQGGLIRCASAGASRAQTLLDIRDRVSRAHTELGLLGAALHPRYPDDRRLFVSYTSQTGGTLRSVVSAWQLPVSSVRAMNVDSRSREAVVLTVRQPYGNHNGGHIAFGPKGALFVGLGDGGSARDPKNHGQNTKSLLGAMLRIDIDHTHKSSSGLSAATTRPYALPADNPVAQNPSLAPEIFAWGLRNPWKFSFDRKTGLLWVGDVGQNRWEEISVVRKGENHGWRVMEGFHCHQPRRGCERRGLSLPVTEYDHTQGQSVTGGYVYRGENPALKELYGHYLFADFASTKIWSVKASAAEIEDRKRPAATRLRARTGFAVSSFCEDKGGELYVLDYVTGRMQRLIGLRSSP